jgi:high affinity Mn2+ porin
MKGVPMPASLRKILKNPSTAAVWCAGHTMLLLLLPVAATAQAASTVNDSPATVFPHPTSSRFWIAGQANIVLQGHGAFRAPYSGENSLRPQREQALSRVFTIYSGYRMTRNSDLLLDLESAGGKGISDAFGIAGFTNLDVVRNPTLGSRPYIARLMLNTVLPVGTDRQPQERGPLSVLTDLPRRRVELRVGKFSTVDFFDVNSAGSDSHLQFLNWTVDNNGAYDYAADTRGYSLGAVAEYHDQSWSVRGGLMLMPTVANGIKLDTHVRQARGENLEVELRPALFADRETTLRLLLFDNHARMGSYAGAIDAFRRGNDALPDITAHRAVGRTKIGIGLNAEQEFSNRLRAFGRLGWNDGRNESFAYTEVDRTAEVGCDWRLPFRQHDKAGIALVSNRISGLHREYLRLGGLGFILGDGTLRYGPERVIEVYYTAWLGRVMCLSADAQSVQNPGYNRDRGPVLVPALRLHVDF